MADYTGIVPTLMVGLGGIGGMLVSKIYNALTVDQKELTAAVCIDTNQIDMGRRRREGLATITTSSSGKRVDEYLKDNPETAAWFPNNPFIGVKMLDEGAGQIRACSRLASEAAIKQGYFVKLDDAIRKVKTMHGDPNLPPLKVIIITSICGGTGAGLVVQIPYYIKHRLDNVAGAKSILFRGYFVGPSITEAKNTERQKAANYTNAYACIKELNAIYKLQNDVEGAKKLNIPFFEDVNQRRKHGDAIEVPYDFIFMFEEFNADGMRTGRFKQQLENISRAILAQCFSVATGDVYGGEDNFVIPRIENNGMDRFGGISMCKAYYPYHEMLSYVADRWIADTAVRDWNAIDKEYHVQLRMANIQTGGRGVEEIGTLADFYIGKFEDDEISSPYLKYYNQTRITTSQEIGDEDSGKTIDLDTSMIDILTERIETLLSDVEEEDLFTSNTPDVSRDQSIIDNYDTVVSQLTRIKNGLNPIISKHSLRIVNKLFPLEYSYDIKNSAKEEALPEMLIKMHPLAARYFLYSFKKTIKDSLDEEKKILSSKTYSKEQRNVIDNTDYYEKTDYKESPIEAEEELYRRLPDFLVKFAPKYKQIYNLPTNVQYTIHLVRKNAYEAILNRLSVLIDIYERLFDSIDHIGKVSAEEAEDLLYMHNAQSGSDHYICASTENKLALYDEVIRSARVNFADIPDEAVRSLTTSIYKLMNYQILESTEDYDPDKVQKQMEKLFRESVIYSMMDVIADKTQSILNMSVIQAIKKAQLKQKKSFIDVFLIFL